MDTAKLTLSVPRPVIAKARRVSKTRGESISSMFAHFVDTVSRELPPDNAYPPKTRRAMQLALGAPPVPPGTDWRAVRDETLRERYAP